MKHGITIENLKCRADINFKVAFRVNDAIGTIVTSGILLNSDNGSFSSIHRSFNDKLTASSFLVLGL